ncbi:MAG: hypothetical protein ACFUZC_15630 [Chthoniobacteraceae bacterium]
MANNSRPPARTVTLGAMPGPQRLRERHRTHLAAMSWPSMLTLTRSAWPGRLSRERLRDTLHAFARMRRMRAFQRVRGGIAALEVSRNPESGTWHDHIHALIDAQWLDIPSLADAWKRALREGGQGSIHLQRLRKPQAALDYITKNATVAADTWDEAETLADELDALLRTPYLTTAWGNCRKP